MRTVALLLSFAVIACAQKVVRTEENIDLSGEWNDVDADAVASSMIEQAMNSPWAQNWTSEHGKKPVVRLSVVRNKSDGYIDCKYFTKQLEAALLNSGRVEVIASLEEADAAREDRADQAEHASDETAKSGQSEAGSDFILTGWILTENDRGQGKEVRSYLTSLELIETETQKKAWVGQKRIKKVVQTDE